MSDLPLAVAPGLREHLSATDLTALCDELWYYSYDVNNTAYNSQSRFCYNPGVLDTDLRHLLRRVERAIGYGRTGWEDTLSRPWIQKLGPEHPTVRAMIVNSRENAFMLVAEIPKACRAYAAYGETDKGMAEREVLGSVLASKVFDVVNRVQARFEEISASFATVSYFLRVGNPFGGLSYDFRLFIRHSLHGRPLDRDVHLRPTWRNAFGRRRAGQVSAKGCTFRRRPAGLEDYTHYARRW